MSDDTITVADFLETEFYFECAQLLKCSPEELSEVRKNQPRDFKQAALRVIYRIATPECKELMIRRFGLPKECLQKLL